MGVCDSQLEGLVLSQNAASSCCPLGEHSQWARRDVTMCLSSAQGVSQSLPGTSWTEWFGRVAGSGGISQAPGVRLVSGWPWVALGATSLQHRAVLSSKNCMVHVWRKWRGLVRPLIVDVLSWVMAALKFLRVSQELLKIEPSLKVQMKGSGLKHSNSYLLGTCCVPGVTSWEEIQWCTPPSGCPCGSSHFWERNMKVR